MKILLLLSLLLIPHFASADVDCNDRANDIRLSDQLDDAIDVLDACLSEELSRVARTYLLLGLTYYDAGEQKKAVANYSKAIEFAPEYVTAYANRGLSHSVSGRHQLALEDFDRAIELDPTYMQAYYFRAYTYQRADKHARAVEDYSTALTLTQDPTEQAKIYYNRARANKALKRVDDALGDYNEAIALNPANAATYFSRALLHHESKNSDAAIADYSRTIELDDQHARAFFNRGLLYRKAGTDFLAIRDFEAATDIDPSFAKAYVNRGYTHMIPIFPLIFILALG